jgi:hypothetical protein
VLAHHDTPGTPTHNPAKAQVTARQVKEQAKALGPGQDQPDGCVSYGAGPGARAWVLPPRPAAERDADMARARDGCSRCSEVPADLIQSLVRALRAAKGGAQ